MMRKQMRRQQEMPIIAVLHDPLFRAYLHLVVEVNGTLAELSAWVERCPCHEHFQQGTHEHGSYAKINVLRAEFGASIAEQMAGHMPCPMSGRRAPELATGALLNKLEDFW